MASSGATSAPGPSAVLKLILLGAIVGIPAAFVAWLFLGLVHVLEELLWTDIPEALDRELPPWWLVLLLPVLGALVVYVARRFLPGDGGHRPLDGIGGPPMPWQHAPSVALAAIGTLAFGAVLGPEAPLIALGSVVGMFVAQQARLPGPAQNVIAQAGSFSAVSALFGGPLVAGVLFLEGALAAGIGIAFLLPGFVAAAVGYLLFVGLGSWDGLSTSPLSVPDLPAYEGTLVVDLLLALVVGVLTAVLMAAVRAGAVRVDVLRAPARPDAGAPSCSAGSPPAWSPSPLACSGATPRTCSSPGRRPSPTWWPRARAACSSCCSSPRRWGTPSAWAAASVAGRSSLRSSSASRLPPSQSSSSTPRPPGRSRSEPRRG